MQANTIGAAGGHSISATPYVHTAFEAPSTTSATRDAWDGSSAWLARLGARVLAASVTVVVAAGLLVLLLGEYALLWHALVVPWLNATGALSGW